jgi:hypothetical protein
MTTVETAVKKVRDSKPDAKVREYETLDIGKAVRQGDVYVHRVADEHPHGKRIGAKLVQIALGSSNGARHEAKGAVKVYAGTTLPEYVTAPQDVQASEITGPLIVADKPWSVVHPEHPHFKLPKGTYQVTYQRDPKTMKRVQD